MRMRKVVSVLSLVTLLAPSVLVSPLPVMAATSVIHMRTSGTSAVHTLVALGDSISFGYNLGNNKSPSKYAFPYLVGAKEHLTVDDLGVPGATTSDLLTALQTPVYDAALKRAALVTVDIGNNDLLQAAAPLIAELKAGKKITVTPSEQQILEAAVLQVAKNLPVILAKIHKLTNAPVLLFNLYNPFLTNTSLHKITEEVLTPANEAIALVALQEKAQLVNAYAAFNNKEAQYILPLDVHPTIAGQVSLADAALADLKAAPTTTPSASIPYGLTLNGVTVHDPYEKTMMKNGKSVLFSSVRSFASVYRVPFVWDSTHSSLTLDGQTVSSALGLPHLYHGELVAPTVAMARAIAAAIGDGVVDTAWIGADKTANVTILPPGYVRTGSLVDGIGQQWINPKLSWPHAPILGMSHGQLIFVEYAVNLTDLQQSNSNVPFMPSHLPIPRIDHVNVVWNPPSSTSGSTVPQVDEYFYFISPVAASAVQ